MRKYAAIAVVEFSSIADGIYCTDFLLKKAPIAMIKHGTVSRGRYLVIIGGSTASVEESFGEALAIGQERVLDHLFLPNVHDAVHDALLGLRVPAVDDAVAILETSTATSNIRATDLAVKGTEVRVVEMRIADSEMSGKAVTIFNGDLNSIQSAMELAADALRGRNEYIQHRIISRPHEGLTGHLTDGTRFTDGKIRELDGEEVS